MAAGALLPLVESSAGRASTSASNADPDQLFKAGRFDAADRGYASLLRKDPANAHALAGRGRIALLSHDFRNAERFLARAIELAPDDSFARRQLADCFIRQDEVARAVPLLRGTGDPTDAAFADQYAAVGGRSYRMSGAHKTRVPFVSVDPLPSVRASINGARARTFLIDTGATLALHSTTAQEANLRAVATSTTHPAGQTLTTYHGVMDSFRLGGIELGDVPVVWYDLRVPDLPDGTKPAGVIGTTLLYHFIATMDYAGRELVLRRKTAAQVRELRAEAGRARTDRLPLWIAGDHVPCSLGSVNDEGPRVASLDTGGMNLAIMMNEQNAKKAGVAIDYDHPEDLGGMKGYPIAPDRIRLGRAEARNVTGLAADWPWLGLFGFDTIGNFTHEFFKPRAITFDYASMDFYIN
ncbi:retropepsin-like aspartic protease [Nonomuraea sediminis]|uniref:retropepsin-like aspartic protease n=1 Tax=Nonomuraea sediminis TaxID=2835864 RepID=UPI001BDC2280|nr:retropepsin-like aspartic protease [Nonomuraea sediminis]